MFFALCKLPLCNFLCLHLVGIALVGEMTTELIQSLLKGVWRLAEGSSSLPRCPPIYWFKLDIQLLSRSVFTLFYSGINAFRITEEVMGH